MATAPATISPDTSKQIYGGSARTMRVGPYLKDATTADWTITTTAARTTLVATTTAAALTGSTTITVSALAAAIPLGATTWVNGVPVTLTAAASSAATTLVVSPLIAGIATGVTINFESVAVTALANPLQKGVTLTFNSGTKAKVIANAAAGATVIYFASPITGAIASGATCTTNLFPTFQQMLELNYTLPKGTAETLQFFGVPASQSKVSSAEQTASVKVASNDFDSALGICMNVNDASSAPGSTLGYIVQFGDGSAVWGYCDVMGITTDGGATTSETKMVEFAIKTHNYIPAYAAGIG